MTTAEDSGKPRMHKGRRVLRSIGILLAVAIGLGACTFEGDSMNQRKANLENQRRSALVLLKNQGGVEKVRFTSEGGKLGLGAPWVVEAVVTIDGREFNEILGPRQLGGDPMPKLPSAPNSRTTVIYSDGSSEVIG